MRTRVAEIAYRYREPEPARERLFWRVAGFVVEVATVVVGLVAVVGVL